MPQVVDGIQLNVGDEVSFVFGVNAKTGDRLARRLRRTKEAPPGAASAHHHHAEFVAEHNPNAMKFVGNRTKVVIQTRCSACCLCKTLLMLNGDGVEGRVMQ